MPNLSGTAVDPGALPTFQTVNLLADVPITGINTQVDIVTFGTVQPGTYVISANLSLAQITATGIVTAKFLNVAAVLASAEASIIIGPGQVVIPPTQVQILVAGIVKLVAFSTALTSTAKSVVVNNGTGTQNFATYASLMRIA